MTPYEVYQDYLALRNHFNSKSYDFFKYRGKGSAKGDSFNKRKDRFFFEKVSKHRDPHGLMLANFVNDPKTWIRDIAYSESAEKVYLDWLKRRDSLTYTFENELSKLEFPFDSNFVIENGQHNHILSLLLGDQISVETFCILVDLVGCIGYMNKQLKDDVVWEEVGTRVTKYIPFIKYDKPKIKKIVLDYFSESK